MYALYAIPLENYEGILSTEGPKYSCLRVTTETLCFRRFRTVTVQISGTSLIDIIEVIFELTYDFMQQ